MHELFTDPFASHVYQAFLNTLSGHPLKNLTDGRTAKKRKTDQDANTPVQTPASFANLQAKLITLVKEWDRDLLQTMVFDKYAVPLLQAIIEIDLPKRKKKSKSKVRQETISDLILFGKDSNTESEGVLNCNFANSRTAGIHKPPASRSGRQPNNRVNTTSCFRRDNSNTLRGLLQGNPFGSRDGFICQFCRPAHPRATC